MSNRIKRKDLKKVNGGRFLERESNLTNVDESSDNEEPKQDKNKRQRIGKYKIPG